jgi:biopolymer transport protein ExbB
MYDAIIAEELSKFFSLIGPVGVILVALSILSIALILFKLVVFGQAGLSRTRAANEFLKRMAENDRDAIEVLEHSHEPLARLLLVGARLARNDASMMRIEAEMRDAATSYFLRLARSNRTLELIGLIAPLLGLLGTIVGMIDAFQALQASGAQADPSVLAGGIWEALSTTAIGLVVAIPAIVAFNLSENRIDRFRQQTSAIYGRFLANVETSRGGF